ncbi:cytochrome P450 704C1-like isoform X2 [Castanea sativa]|uniref:cytochrome P450 704C1-like isoform X2 n=1 Tax=Castanea sativa TaxID=21020 RepID=UPI003F64BBA4
MNLMDFLFNPISFTAIISFVILAISVINFHARRSPKNRKKYHPVAGTSIHQLVNFHRLHDFMTELSSKHRTFRLLDQNRALVYTADPANVEHLLKTNFQNYGKGWFHYNILTDLLGDGIFTVDGEKWRHQRKESSYEFSTNMLKNFSSVVFKTNAVKLSRILSEAVSSNRTIEIQDLFMKSSLDSVFKIVLGVELDSMCGTYEEGIRFSNAFDEASAITSYRYVDIFWKIKRFLNIGSEAMLRNNMKMKKGDILSRFLELRKTDPKYLKDIILSFMIAGKDTTASTLSWFIYLLCKHPHIQEKIALEVRESTNLKDNSSIDELANSMTEEALVRMQYLHAALTETLRLYPAVPVDGKICFSDDTWPDGYSVRKGDAVAYYPYAMGRMKFLWGDDAEEFRPERWLDENCLFQQESPFKFTAFQAGPRICLGKEFAYRQMKIFSAVLLGSYIFKLSDEKKSITYRTMLTLQIDGGLHIRAIPRLGHVIS